MRLHETYIVRDVSIIVRREDARYKPPLPPHAKMGVIELLCKKAKAEGYTTIGCFGSKYSNWIVGVPIIAAKHNLASIVCYPANDLSGLPEWFRPEHGTVKLLRPNMVTINQSQAKKYVESVGGFFIPFGFDMPEVVNTLSEQLTLPEGIGCLVLSCGSGITLASVLRSIKGMVEPPKQIVGVSSGRSIDNILATVRKHEQVPKRVKLYRPYDYSEVPEIECPWPAHDHFELKAYHWLIKKVKKIRQPVYFLNIGANP